MPVHVHSYLELQLFSFKDIRIFLSSAILESRLQKILLQWSMEHSEDDVNQKKPHKMKMHLPNQLELSVLVCFKVGYRTRYKNIDVILDYTMCNVVFHLYFCNTHVQCSFKVIQNMILVKGTQIGHYVMVSL